MSVDTTLLKPAMTHDSDLDIRIGDIVYVKGWVLFYSANARENVYGFLEQYTKFIVVNTTRRDHFWIELNKPYASKFSIKIKGVDHPVTYNTVYIYHSDNFKHPENELFTIKKESNI